jgi:hypothetical protein
MLDAQFEDGSCEYQERLSLNEVYIYDSQPAVLEQLVQQNIISDIDARLDIIDGRVRVDIIATGAREEQKVLLEIDADPVVIYDLPLI